MKRTIYLLLAVVLMATEFAACKSKKSDKTTTPAVTTTTVDSTPPAPVQISPDDALITGAKDAIKDFPGVTASVNDGEVTLTGTIKRDRLPVLMQSINALQPKKVNNKLIVQP